MTKSIKTFTRSRRHLPHWQSPGVVYFITTRCIQGKNLTPKERDIVIEAIKYLNIRKYILYAAVVMPDHFHIIIQPVEKESVGQASSPVHESSSVLVASYFSLSEIMHSLKGYTAHRIGGQVWQDENFDRIIRDDNELIEKINYIVNNPLKLGLIEDPDDYKWLVYAGGQLDLN